MIPGAGLCLKALQILSGDRPVSVGMGGSITGNIPFASLVAFAERYGIDDLNEFDGFARIIRAIDTAELTLINEKNNPPR
jgi:hypothetical protein